MIMAAAEQAIRCIRALESLKNLMDVYDDFNDGQPITKKKVLVTSQQIEKQLLKDVAWKSSEDDDTFCPMNMDNFEDIVKMLRPKIVKTNKKNTFKFPVRIRVAITLRYIITGESYRSLETLSHVSHRTIKKIVPQILKALIEVFENENLMAHMTDNDWYDIANDFNQFWQFPHTLGVIDGKHITNKTSTDNTTGSNLNSFFLLTVIDAHSRFIHIDIINSDQCKPTHAYINSNFYQALTSKTCLIPENEPLEGQSTDTRYSFIADNFLEMDRYIIKLYEENEHISRSQKEFNRRLKRARLPVNMAFEILFYRFKIFERTIDIHVKLCSLVIKACCLLHNYFTQNLLEIPKFDDNNLEQNLPVSILQLPTQNCEKYNDAIKMRENVRSYCVNEKNIQKQHSPKFDNAVIEFE